MTKAFRRMSLWRRLTLALGLGLIAMAVALFCVAGRLMAPVPRHVGPPPQDLGAEAVSFPSESGSQIHGWYATGKPNRATVVLLHSLRGDRRAMLGRARFLLRAGYGVLMIDFQAHGESRGERITFGHLESRDAQAAVAFARQRRPSSPVAVIGESLGGAACLLGPSPLAADALILEAVYPSLKAAVHNRVALRLGPLAGLVAPLLTTQCRLRLGVSASALQPIEGMAKLGSPVLVIGGDEERRTTVAETKRLYEAASGPKELWIIPGAGHGNLHGLGGAAYEAKVLGFLERHL